MKKYVEYEQYSFQQFNISSNITTLSTVLMVPCGGYSINNN